MNGSEQLGRWISNNPIIIIFATLLITLSAVHYAQQIEMQGLTTESMVGKDSALYQVYDHLYVQNFGTASIAVLIEAGDVAKPEVLRAMLTFSDKMKEAPDVLSVTSIADIVADTEKESSGIRAIPDQERIDEILSADNPILAAILPDRSHTMLSIELPVSLTESEQGELYQETRGQLQLASFPADTRLTVTGDPALMNSITAEMAESNGPILLLAAFLMIVALLITFNQVKWSLLPIPIVFLGVGWTFGAMGLLHIPFTMVSMSAFPVLIGIGIDYAIQFQNRINEEFTRTGQPQKAVIETVKHVTKPVIIALIITSIGFVSLLTSSIPMIRDFGLLCLIGLILCFLSALFVGVTILYIAVGKRLNYQPTDEHSTQDTNADDRGEVGPRGEGTIFERMLTEISGFCIERWQLVLALALLLSLAGIYSDTQVPVDTDFKNYVPQDLPPLIDYWHMSQTFGGTDSIQLLVQADDVTDPRVLEWMDEFSIYLKGSRDQILGYTSIASLTKEANQGTLPKDRTIIRMLIDALPANWRDIYLDGHNTAVIDLNVGQTITILGTEGSDRLMKEIDKDIAWNPPPAGVSVRMTGDAVVMTTVITALTKGRTEMTLFGLLLIFIVLLAIYRDLIKALLPVLPMLVVIGWMGGVMYISGMKYTPLTACLGALILGVGSEYAILMMERFYEELEKIGDPRKALSTATRAIGSALIASGLTTVFGFAALISSPFLITNNFGMVTVLAIVFALATTFTVFVVLIYRMELRRELVKNAIAGIFKAFRLIRPEES